MNNAYLESAKGFIEAMKKAANNGGEAIKLEALPKVTETVSIADNKAAIENLLDVICKDGTDEELAEATAIACSSIMAHPRSSYDTDCIHDHHADDVIMIVNKYGILPKTEYTPDQWKDISAICYDAAGMVNSLKMIEMGIANFREGLIDYVRDTVNYSVNIAESNTDELIRVAEVIVDIENK